MYKFFLPILIFLVGLWIYVGVFENGKREKEEAAQKVVAEYEYYNRLNDSISTLPEYANFSKVTEQAVSLFIPSYLSLTTDLTENSSFQYKNGSKEFYMLMYHENSGDYYTSVKDYVNYTISGIKGIVSDFFITDSSYVKVNNGAVYRIDIQANFYTGQEKLPLKYIVIVSEFEGVFYDLTLWTTRDFLPENEKDMEKIISSITFSPDIEKARLRLY